MDFSVRARDALRDARARIFFRTKLEGGGKRGEEGDPRPAELGDANSDCGRPRNFLPKPLEIFHTRLSRLPFSAIARILCSNYVPNFVSIAYASLMYRVERLWERERIALSNCKIQSGICVCGGACKVSNL